MTKLILAGGSDRGYPDYWMRLSQVVLREVENPTILSCMFSHPLEARPFRHRQFDELFEKTFPNSRVIHADEEDFYNQIISSDVVYLHGGTTQMLLDSIHDVNKFKDAIKGKIVIGSSAGANVLSEVCFSPSASKVMQGMGVLNIGVVVHYGIEQFKEVKYTHGFWEEAASNIKVNLTSEQQLLLLPEGEFAIFEL